jgi:hypothetical protein
MKRLALLPLLCALSAPAADLYVFSSDATNVLSRPRELPSAALRLDTREAVFGLHALSDAERGACGWYRVLPPERPEWATNHVAVVTNYHVRAEWVPREEPIVAGPADDEEDGVAQAATVVRWELRTEGLADSLARWKEIPRRSVKLDRDKVAAAVRAAGFGEMLDNWTRMPIELAQWYFSEMEYVPDGAIARSIMQQFGWTKEQLEAFVETCRAE